jgi:hypothetical protein
MLHILTKRVRQEIIALDVMRLQLFEMTFEIIVKNLDCHFALKPSPLTEIVIDLLLEVHKVLILPSDFQGHQVFRNQLLSLDLMEELLISDQVSASLFGVFHLFKFDHQNVIELFEVLFHVFDRYFSGAIKLNLFDFTVEILLKLLGILFIFHHLRIVFVHVKFIIHERSFVLIDILVQVGSHPGDLTIGLTNLKNHLFPELFMDHFIFG